MSVAKGEWEWVGWHDTLTQRASLPVLDAEHAAWKYLLSNERFAPAF